MDGLAKAVKLPLVKPWIFVMKMVNVVTLSSAHVNKVGGAYLATLQIAHYMTIVMAEVTALLPMYAHVKQDMLGWIAMNVWHVDDNCIQCQVCQNGGLSNDQASCHYPANYAGDTCKICNDGFFGVAC